jgi:hypothetical protein
MMLLASVGYAAVTLEMSETAEALDVFFLIFVFLAVFPLIFLAEVTGLLDMANDPIAPAGAEGSADKEAQESAWRGRSNIHLTF